MSPPRNLTRAQFYIPRGLLLGLCLLLICGGLGVQGPFVVRVHNLCRGSECRNLR